MAKTTYKKKVKNGTEYYFYRLRHKNLKSPKDIYSRTVKELEEKLKSITRELDYGVVSNGDEFEPFFRDWLFDVHCINKKPSTKERYESLYRNHIKASQLSDIRLKDISSKDIQDYYNHMIRDGKTVSIVKSLNKLLAPCIRYAYNSNLIMKDFSKAIVLPDDTESTKLNRTNDVKPMSLEEQKEFLKSIEGHDLEMLFITALNTGLRQGELLALTWDDVDFINNLIRVNKNIKSVAPVSKDGREKSQIIIQTPKTRESIREVTVPSFLTLKLKQYKAKQSQLRLQMANQYEDNNLVFATKQGKYFDSSNILKRFKKILRDNHLEDRKFHDLRHTYATRLFELGENPKTVQYLLGHSNISTTLDTYTHVLDSMKEKAVSKLDGLFANMVNL